MHKLKIIFSLFLFFSLTLVLGQSKKNMKMKTKTDTTKLIEVQNDTIFDDEIQVGYGTMLRSRSTQSIATITEKEIKMTVNANIQQAIQGRVAGVQVVNSGEPGGKYSAIYVRGLASIYGNNQPLIVVDGYPTTFDYLTMMNSNDIERIDILKDAASCAIYGARGGNGVILIKTK